MNEQGRKEKSEAQMVQRMQSGDFTFSSLYAPYGGSSPEYREADRLIQKMRKAGKINQIGRGLWRWVAEVSDGK